MTLEEMKLIKHNCELVNLCTKYAADRVEDLKKRVDQRGSLISDLMTDIDKMDYESIKKYLITIDLRIEYIMEIMKEYDV